MAGDTRTERKGWQVAWRVTVSLVTITATLVASAAASASDARRAVVVGPGESIQAAVDAAEPGATIVVRGVHRENVAVETDRLTLRGRGAVLLPPATPTAHACFDPTEVGEAVHGVCVIGEIDFDTGDVSRRVEGVTVSGFTVRGFTGSGLLAVAAHGTTFRDNRAQGNTDAGLSAAQSTATRVLGSRASGGRFGIFLTASAEGRIVGNLVHDNCVGLFAFDLGLGPSGGFDVAANTIRHNTRACAAGVDFPDLSGIGVALVGGARNRVLGNVITDNVPTGATALSGGVAVIASPAGPAPTDTRVRGNAILRNDPDVFWDGTGTGNVLEPNRCRTSVPAALCG